MEEKMKRFIEIVKESNQIVFFGGAGVSTESGIPDFRSKDGLYNQHDVQFEKYQPEYVIVWGKRLWNNLPNVGWQDGDDIVVDGYPVATGAYLLSNGKQVKVMAVNHPSVGYSWDYWHKVIQRFLR